MSGANGRAGARAVRLVHVMTVPQSFVLLRGQTRFMRARGFEVTGVASAGPQAAVYAREEGVEVVSVAMPRQITPLRDLAALWALCRVIIARRPHIVHAHTPKGGLLGMLAAWVCRVPVRVYHMRGLPLETATGMRRHIFGWSERVSCALAHRVFCVSHSLRGVAIAERLVAPQKIVVFFGGSGNGVDARDRYAPGPDAAAARAAARAAWGVPAEGVVAAFLGRLVRDKGVVELAAAWALLRDAHPAAHLVLAGPLEDRDPVPPEVVAALRDDPRVHLLGLVDDTRAVYAGADVVVHPSHREGFPNVPLEAAAMERPVVTTDVAGCRDAVADGVTGAVVPAGNAEALAAALASYLGNAALRRAHGAAGRARVLADFSPERIWAAYHAEYLRLLALRGVGGPVDPTAGAAVPHGAAAPPVPHARAFATTARD